MNQLQAKTLGVHHVGLTVLDLAAAQAFFESALGFSVIGGRPEYPAVFISDGTVMLTLWQVEDPAAAAPFDRRRVLGLHHFALRVSDVAALERLHAELVVRDDVEIEFSPEPLGETAIRHMMCTIPGGLRLELIAAGS